MQHHPLYNVWHYRAETCPTMKTQSGDLLYSFKWLHYSWPQLGLSDQAEHGIFIRHYIQLVVMHVKNPSTHSILPAVCLLCPKAPKFYMFSSFRITIKITAAYVNKSPHVLKQLISWRESEGAVITPEEESKQI